VPANPTNPSKPPSKQRSTPETGNPYIGNVSSLFDKPKSGHIAVKVINHIGYKVVRVFSVS
jgi:hypothetical protein